VVKGKTVEEALHQEHGHRARAFASAGEDSLFRARRGRHQGAIGDWKKKHGIEVPVAEKAFALSGFRCRDTDMATEVASRISRRST